MKFKPLLFIFILTLSLTSACQVTFPPRQRLTGKGKVASQSFPLSEEGYSLIIADINLVGSNFCALTIDEDLPSELTLATEGNIADAITITIDEDTKEIRIEGKSKYDYRTDNFIVQVGVPLVAVKINGAVELESNLPSVETFSLAINGAASGSLAFGQLDYLQVTINGACELILSGQCQEAELVVNGASSLDASQLATQDSEITVNGAGSCTIRVANTLNANVNGVGTIDYIGSPTVKKTIAGLGSISQKEE